ncbi:MAG: NADPH-dependent F420 reductase [Thermoplasmatota archaeon]
MDRIGVLGSGDVGKALAAGFAKHGHDVIIGTRDPSKLTAWAKAGGGHAKIAVGTFADAAKHGDVLILALHGTAAEAAIDLAGAANFDGKLVLDATNPLAFVENGFPGLFVGTQDSLGERIQRKLPRAHVVKCFNTVGHVNMIDPHFREGSPLMLIAGNDAAAKKKAEHLVREVGWPGVIDTGDITGARWLEAAVPLWVRVGANLQTFGHAFHFVRQGP